LKEKRRKRPFDERVMTIEKIRIHVLILNLPQPLLRALRQSRTRSSRVRYSHRRRRSSSCHFLEQQQPQQKGLRGKVCDAIFRKEYYFFSPPLPFLRIPLRLYQKEKSTSCNSDSSFLSLSFSLLFKRSYNKTDDGY
jgi:hypothetical protein